jgi:mRNA interferase MazF
MKKGDIVLIPFPFTDLSGNKLRPALVLISAKADVTVAFITTQMHWKEPNDVIVSQTNQNGLKQESLIRLSKLATIDSDLVDGILGEIDGVTMDAINKNLIDLLQLEK